MRAWNCHAVGTLGSCSGTGTNGFLELCFGRGKLPKVGGPIKVAQNAKKLANTFFKESTTFTLALLNPPTFKI